MAEQAHVLWCGQCKKPFTKQSTLKRHGYYCRSSKKASVPRPRSCAACAKAKTACNSRLPACSRCAQKGFTCQYPPKSVTKRLDAVDTSRVVPRELHSSDRDQTNTIIPAAIEQAHNIQELTPASDGSMLFDDVQWNFHDMTAFRDSIHSTSQSTSLPTTPSSSLASADPPTVLRHSLLSETTDPALQEQLQLTPQRQQQSYRPQLMDFFIQPAPNQHVRSMMQRPKVRPGADRTASLIFYTLKSYPLMLRRNNLPPFIHTSSVSFTDEGTTNEPLENCIALIHMMTNGAPASRKLFWRNVQQELERMCDQNQIFSKWELLGAMQALSIYVLIRLDEGETEYNNLDYLLERAVILIAIRLSHDDFDCHADHLTCSSKSESSWQDWIYKESRRRLAVIYRILNKLIFFSPAAMCDMPAEFIIAPLPAKRQLWEAKDRQEWELQSQKEPREQTSYALAVDGEIIKLEQCRLSCRDAWLAYAPLDEETASRNYKSANSCSASWWAEWCSGMDSMGGLIMLAASMV